MKEKRSVRTSEVKYHFQTQSFEFVFQWLLGMHTNGGSEIGETFFAASKIEEGNPASWNKVWTELGQRVEARGQASLNCGHRVSARESYLRAYCYYRAPLAFMDPNKDPRFKPSWEKAVGCFRQACALFDPPLEAIAIPFEGNMLPGYFLKASQDSQPRKTLIMIGGGDTFVEDLYLFIGPLGVKRGYNVLMVDLPGQGILPLEGLYFRPDAEIPMGAVVDYALARPDVDPQQLVAFGISGGGYLVPRAATKDKRIKALVACSAITDFYDYWTQDPALLRFARNEFSFLMQVLKRLLKLEPLLLMLESYEWRWGVAPLAPFLEAQRLYHFDPAEISCPVLMLIGEREYAEKLASHAQQHQMLERVAHPRKQLVITPANEGADSHAVGTNLSLMSQLVFDWLDETLERL
jgi:pimeloyl-ACP methyl ester carboxylesterase